MTPPVGLAPNGNGQTGRTVVGLAPKGTGAHGRAVVGLAPKAGTATKKGGGGGFFHALTHVGHVIAQKAEVAGHDIKSIPGGAIDFVNRGAVQPWKDVLTTGHVSKKTGKNIDQLIQQTADQTSSTIAHPLRDPFQTALLLSPALHVAGRGALGAGEAAGALKAGEGVKGAVRAARVRPEHLPRTLKSGEAKVPLLPSRNAAARIGQKAYDTTLQRGIEKKPQGRVAAHAQKRIGGALKEEARIGQQMRAAPAAMLDRAAAKLSKVPGRRREEQAALELASVNTTAEEAARYHLGQAAKGVNEKRNLAVGHLYERVAARGLLTKDKAGNVTVDAAKHSALGRADTRLARVQGEGDKILVAKGVREEKALESRRNAPGRIRAGATYEKPTPAKAGISPALIRATAERDRLVRLHERALDQEAKWSTKTHAGVATKDLRAPLTDEAAQAKLAEAEAEHRALLEKLVPEVSPYSAEDVKAETRSRNTLRGRMAAGKKPATGKSVEGRVGGGSKTIKTVSQEQLDLAQHKLDEIISAHPENPVAQVAARLQNERETLRQQLTARGEASLEGTKAQPLPKTGKQPVVPAASNPYRNRVVQLGTRLEATESKVERLAQSTARKIKPTGIVGGETARPGRGFVSARISEKKLGKAEASASPGPVVGVAKSPLDAKTFTGRSIEQGLVPKNVTGAAAQHFRQILRFVNTDAQRRRALETGSDVRRSNRDVLVRLPDETPEKLSPAIQQALGRERSTVDTAHELATQEGLHAAHEAFLEHLIPDIKSRFANDRAEGIGTQAPDGYRWVDRGALGDLTRAPLGPRGRIARSTDTVNSAVTALTVYFKVGHVGTRVFTNAATNIMQGSAAPLNVAKSFRLWHRLSDEEKVRALAASGQHGFAALPHEGTNAVARFAGWGAQQWARHADAPFRFNALSFELRKAGYKTPAQFRRALDGLETHGNGMTTPEWSKLSAAARRSDREAISYDRLNDFERRYLTRGLWFYPWIKGSTIFTVRSAIEHPFKSAALGIAGQHGRQLQEQQLGQVPSYEQGLVHLAGSGGSPLVSDFSTFSPFATGADVLEAPGHPGAAAGFLNPVAGATGQLVYGLNQYGGPSKKPYLDALQALGAATPEQQLAQTYANRNTDQSGHLFTKTVPGTLARYLVGPGMPRHVNKTALAKAAALERSGRR